MKLLLTGFEPFGTRKQNISWDIAESLSMTSINDVEIATAQLPVSFLNVRNKLYEQIIKHSPNAIIMLGESSLRSCIEIESVAMNLMNATSADNCGYSPKSLPIDISEQSALFSNMPINNIVKILNDNGIKTLVSDFAGLYVCNCAFFHALQIAQNCNPNMLVGFIHLPVDDTIVSRANKRKAIELTINALWLI